MAGLHDKQGILSFTSWQSPGKAPRPEGSIKTLTGRTKALLAAHLCVAGPRSKGPQCSAGGLRAPPPPRRCFKGDQESSPVSGRKTWSSFSPFNPRPFLQSLPEGSGSPSQTVSGPPHVRLPTVRGTDPLTTPRLGAPGAGLCLRAGAECRITGSRTHCAAAGGQMTKSRGSSGRVVR